MTETTKQDLCTKLYEALEKNLKEVHKMQLSDLREGKKNFLVSFRTMQYLRAKILPLRPVKVAEICKKLGLNFHHKDVYFIDF